MDEETKGWVKSNEWLLSKQAVYRDGKLQHVPIGDNSRDDRAFCDEEVETDGVQLRTSLLSTVWKTLVGVQ